MSSIIYRYIFGFTATIIHWIYINYLYLLNTIQWILGWKFPELKPTDLHSVSPVWRIVVIYYLICSRLLHWKWISPNSKEKNIVFLQMSVDHYIFNDMRQILVKNIKIHMNVYSADMMSSEIVNLTILVEVQNVKTFYQNNM
jgi:DNA-directed RNA polymerase subunit L